MLNSFHFNNQHAAENSSDIDSLNVTLSKKFFARFCKLMVFVLLFQLMFDNKREREAEIEEELPDIQFNILPTFLVKREKIT